jgi:circadian clock protein KaiC
MSTGVAGLDDILGGGFPPNRLYLVQGDPGVGKTTLALHFLRDGAAKGESGVYITLSETEEELRGVAHSHGWELDGISLLELTTDAGRLQEEERNTLFHPSEIELSETTREIIKLMERTKPKRVVFDSLSELRLLAQSALRYRRQILALKQFFAGRGTTVLMLDDRTSEDGDLQLQSLAHGVVEMEQLSPGYGSDRRRMRVVKLRGARFRGGYHDFNIKTGGLEVYPRLIAAEHHEPFLRESLASGITELDQLLGGGLDRGTSTLLMGPAGSGKSVLATLYARAAAERGERAAIFTFDEGRGTHLARSEGLGLQLQPYLDSGKLTVQQVDPAELAPGEFVATIRHVVENTNARVVVIDSLNGFMKAMVDDRFLTLQLHELLAYLAQRGTITIMNLAQHGMLGAAMQSPIDVSYLADTVVLTRYYEARGEIHKAVSVVKKRTGAHERSLRELIMGPGGVQVGPVLREFRGVLTGVPEVTSPPAVAGQ